MLSDLLLIAAILASAAVVFQVAARLGALGPQVRDLSVRNSHMRVNIILGAVLWVAWAYLVGM